LTEPERFSLSSFILVFVRSICSFCIFSTDVTCGIVPKPLWDESPHPFVFRLGGPDAGPGGIRRKIDRPPPRQLPLPAVLALDDKTGTRTIPYFSHITSHK